jgi:hypothetical protein
MENLILALKLFMIKDEFNKYNKSLQNLCFALFYLLEEMPSPDMLRSKTNKEPESIL